jgi:hypothetical protein
MAHTPSPETFYCFLTESDVATPPALCTDCGRCVGYEEPIEMVTVRCPRCGESYRFYALDPAESWCPNGCCWSPYCEDRDDGPFDPDPRDSRLPDDDSGPDDPITRDPRVAEAFQADLRDWAATARRLRSDSPEWCPICGDDWEVHDADGKCPVDADYSGDYDDCGGCGCCAHCFDNGLTP